jgi:hypothetical protein
MEILGMAMDVVGVRGKAPKMDGEEVWAPPKMGKSPQITFHISHDRLVALTLILLMWKTG